MKRTFAVSWWAVSALILAGATFGCGGSSGVCSVSKNDASSAVTISCDDGTSQTFETKSGTASDCSVKTVNGKKTIECADGTSVTLQDGAQGQQGDKGAQGDPGAQGDKGAQGDQGDKGASGDVGPEGRSAYVVGAGLALEVTDVSIPDDLHPVVTLRMQDASGNPLDRTGKYTEGTVNASFTLSWLQSSGGQVGEYVPYITGSVTGATVANVPPALPSATQPRSENNGEWSVLDSSMGTYKYRLSTALPSDYDKSKTHTLAIYASRTYADVAYVSNPLFNFRPDGEDVTEKRDIITTEGCNGCHDTLQAHGGSRREVGLCITCHVTGMSDPESGNSIAMSQMIHKIHSGSKLPSVVAGTHYEIVGYRNSVHDYSGVTFPQDLENCGVCHKGPSGDRWKTNMTRTACGSCHDRTSFVSPAPSGYKLHTGGALSTDELCMNCHAEGRGPIATLETDVVKVHKTLEHFPFRDLANDTEVDAPVLSGTIVSVSPTGPSDSPVVRFTVAVNGMPYDILGANQQVTRLRFTFAGPTTDYAGYLQYTALGTDAVGTLAAGSTAGEFTWTVPAGDTMTTIATACATDPAGSFAVGMEARLTRDATKPDATVVSVNYAMHNPVMYFPVTDSEVVPRRQAVVVDNCNVCHGELAAHGGSRNDPEYCVLCHNANKDTTGVPLPAAGSTALTASLRLSHMIHRIHTGDEGESPYVVRTNDFSEVLFPGDRRDCTNCHVQNQYRLPLSPLLLPSYMTEIDSTGTRVPNSDYYMGATGAACTGCHDSDDTRYHVESMTTDLGKEACGTCHGTGAAFDIDVVHARPGQ